LTAFVDTSVWYSAADRGDKRHEQAARILSEQISLVTSDHVLVESWNLMRNRLGASVADAFWDDLRMGSATLEVVSEGDLDTAWTIAREYQDQGFSVTDCTSFALMVRLGIDRAASFDQHFAIYRFGRQRDRAFTLVN
jgi:predicted nucleic acid-binding protein